MFTARENMRRCVANEKPDRFVNQYEALQILPTPFMMFHNPRPEKGGPEVVNAWGVTNAYPENSPSAFPVHTPDKVVIKDIEEWQDYVKAPSLDYPDEEWAKAKALYDAVDRTKSYACTIVAPGLFEQTHHLCGMDEALVNYMMYEDEMGDLLKFLTDWELQYAELVCSKLHPDAILHHDDWGSQDNTFLPPSLFEDFFLDHYKEIYKYYHEHGVEIIAHHSDSFGATIVPYMIEMGIDVWQGPMSSNNVPELVKQYGKQISFMGMIDNKFVDFDGSTYDDCVKTVKDVIEAVGTNEGFIPCITQGGPGSLYIGAYEGLWQAIDEYNTAHFGFTQEELDNARMPMSVTLPGRYKSNIKCRYIK